MKSHMSMGSMNCSSDRSLSLSSLDLVDLGPPGWFIHVLQSSTSGLLGGIAKGGSFTTPSRPKAYMTTPIRKHNCKTF